MPTPTDDLLAARSTAGAAYATAVANFWSAWIELHAIELALLNTKFRTANTPGIGLYTVGPDPIHMRHVAFAPTLTNRSEPAFNLPARVQARATAIIENGGAA